jgi:hypothetical protein
MAATPRSPRSPGADEEAGEEVAPAKFTDSDPGMGLGPEQWPEGSPQRRIYEFMEGSLFGNLTIAATFWCLFAPDVQVVVAPKVFDYPAAIVTLSSFCLFCFELIGNFYVGRDYGGLPGMDKITMFLIIDIVGTISIIPEFLILIPGIGSVSPAGNLTLARAGRSARIGARLGRLVRLFRVQEDEPEYGLDGQKLETEPSEIGHIVADQISSRVVFVVICLIILMPAFLYSPAPQHQRFSLELFKITHPTPNIDDARQFMEWYNHCDYSRCKLDEELVGLKSSTLAIDRRTDLPTEYDDYRDKEFEEIKQASGFTATYQTTQRDVKESMYSIVFLVSAVLMFGGGAATFLTDIQEHVIVPIEELKALCDNMGETLKFLTADGEDDEVDDEVQFLDNAVSKMAGLLTVGYGEAGTAIIARNLQGTSEKIDPLLPGVKVRGVVCRFCRGPRTPGSPLRHDRCSHKID